MNFDPKQTMIANERTFVTFDADFPDDSEWDENENISVPGGRALAAWFRERLLERGVGCSEPAQHSFYGWQFDVCVGKRAVTFVLQGGNPWILIAQGQASALRPLAGENDCEPLRHFLLAIQTLLAASSRFSSVRWFTRAEYEAGRRARGTEAP
jgi:hypothetical protein